MKNKKIKNIIIITIIVILTLLAILTIYFIKDHEKEIEEDKVALTLKDNLTIEFGEEKKVSDFIENLQGTLINDDEIDTGKLGTQTVTFEYTSIRNKKKTKNFEIKIVDTKKPEIFMENSITVKTGYNKDLTKIALSGDDCDANPTRSIEGEYDLNQAGSYKLKYIVTDASGNTASKDFTLNVVDKLNTTTTTNDKIQFSDAIQKYKTAKTEIGIDVSQWQGDIDWEAVKNAGVEFAYIRVGYQKGYDGDNEIDPYFEKNMQGAAKNGIKIGIYFYSYAKTVEEGESQANWVIDQLKDYKIDLPVAFDWESWSSFTTCNMSFYDINNIAKTYIKTLENNNYEGSLYSSKYYLERIWYADKYSNTWLAHYISKTTYTGSFQTWQFCNTGKIDGINGDVDIDVMYK